MYDACSCDYDPPDFCSVVTRKARKRHVCDECRAIIQPRDTYEYVFGSWEGSLGEFKICALCLELRQWAKISVPCFCWCYGDMHENIRDMVDEVRHDVPRGFVFEWGRRIIKIERKRYGQHWPRRAHHAHIAQRRAEARARTEHA